MEGAEHVRTAAEWVDSLPAPGHCVPPGEHTTGTPRRESLSDQAEMRVQATAAPVRLGSRFLGTVELFGASTPGRLTLTADTLRFDPASGVPREWPLGELTAVQSSSGTLQLKARRHPVVQFRFTTGSLRLWESVLEATLAAYYRRRGLGEIAEFQPRIAVR